MTMTLGGSGTIVGLATGGITDATITQSELADAVASTGPAFSVYSTLAQTLTVSSTGNVLQANVKEYDTSSAFNNTNGTVNGTPAYSFRPTVAGYYLFNGQIQFNGDSTQPIIMLFKNGVETKRGFVGSVSATAARGAGVTGIIYLNGSSDYVTMNIYTASAATTDGAAPIIINYFQGCLIRAAATVPAASYVATALNGPAFSAYRATAQSIPASTLTKLQLTGKEYDTNNCFDSTTNFRFTPTVAGYYLFNGQSAITGATGGSFIAYLFKNGTLVKRGQLVTMNTTDSMMVSVTGTLFLNGSTDYVELWIYQSSSGALNTANFSAAAENRLDGQLVRLP